MKKAGKNGDALVEFTVEHDGSVHNVVIVRATNEAFGQAAAGAIARWKFRPGTIDGQPVRTRMQQPFGFMLNED
jgi:TonB family protein